MARLVLRSSIAPAFAVLLAVGLAGCDDGPTVVKDVVPPAPPQGLYTVTGDQRVDLFWVRNTEPDFATYRIWRSPAFEGPYTSIGQTPGTAFVDATIGNGQTFFYAVSAVDAAGNESELSEEEVFDTPRPEGFGVRLFDYEANPDGTAGYDFSNGDRQLALDPTTDIYYAVQGGVRLLLARDLATDIQDAGYRDLDELDWAPGAGWSPTGSVEVVVGHSYYAWTRDGNYAKLRVTFADDQQVYFDWAYQLVPGNRELHPRQRDKPIP
jgi:hypothetical protein